MIKGMKIEIILADTESIRGREDIDFGTIEMWDGDRDYELYFEKIACSVAGNVLTIDASEPSEICPDYKKISGSISVNCIFKEFHLSMENGDGIPAESIRDLVLIDETGKRLGFCQRAFSSVLKIIKGRQTVVAV